MAGREAAGAAGAPGAAAAGEAEFWQFEKGIEQEKERFLTKRLREYQSHRAPTYALGVGDLVTISVYGLPDLSGQSRVRPNGTISLPLLEEVQVSGLTEDELQRRLAGMLQPYVRQPRVQVFIDEYRAHLVSIIGEVARPGGYPLRRNQYSILDLLTEAGGLTDKAGSKVVLIPSEHNPGAGGSGAFHRNPNQDDLEFDIDELYGDASRKPLFLPLLPGDMVVIPKRGIYHVTGEVKSPGEFPLKSRMSVMGAIAAAGGLEYSADVAKVELIRNIGGNRQAVLSFDLEQVALKQGQDYDLRDGDIVRVPSQPGRFWRRQVVEFVNGFFSVGVSQ
jgi:polysaccharide biosynthesis/export protein